MDVFLEVDVAVEQVVELAVEPVAELAVEQDAAAAALIMAVHKVIAELIDVEGKRGTESVFGKAAILVESMG